MKIFKILIASIVISSFFLTTNVNAQAAVWNFDHPHIINQPCLGEALHGQMFMHFVENGKFRKTNLSGEYVGEITGKTYKLRGNWKWVPGTPVFNISLRLIGDNGLAYMLHAVYKNDTLYIDGCK